MLLARRELQFSARANPAISAYNKLSPNDLETFTQKIAKRPVPAGLFAFSEASLFSQRDLDSAKSRPNRANVSFAI